MRDVHVETLENLQKDGAKEEGEVDEGDRVRVPVNIEPGMAYLWCAFYSVQARDPFCAELQDTLQSQGTDLTIIHEGIVQLKEFNVALRIRLTSSLMYPYRVPELRLANAHGSDIASSLLADIEADVNCNAPLRDQDDPLPGQLICLVQHLAADI